MTVFAMLAKSRVDHERLAFAMAAELGRGGHRIAAGRLEGLAVRCRESGEPDELRAICAVIGDQFAVRHGGPVLLTEVLLGSKGHPDTLAVLATCIAARAWSGANPIGLVTDGTGLYLAHKELGAPTIADLGRSPAIFDGRTLGEDLYWQCAHEAALKILCHVAARAELAGDIVSELSVLALALALPLSMQAREAFEYRHRTLLAKLN